MRTLILPTLVGCKIHANLNITFGAIPKGSPIQHMHYPDRIKILETPIIEVLAQKSLLTLDEGRGTLGQLKLAKKIKRVSQPYLYPETQYSTRYINITVDRKKIHRYKSMLLYIDYVIATSQYVRYPRKHIHRLLKNQDSLPILVTRILSSEKLQLRNYQLPVGKSF